MEQLPLLDDDYLGRLYSGQGRSPIRIAGRYLGRAAKIIASGSADLYWIHCDLFPYLPSFIDRLPEIHGRPVVFDYDDAIFHGYDQHRSLVVRLLFGRKIDKSLKRADMVLAGNPYLAARAHAAGAARIEIVPTVVDITAYDPTDLALPDGMSRIGWIGTPSTWAQYMLPMLPMLVDLADDHGAVIRTVGAGPEAKGRKLENLPWAENTESTLIHGMDIGLMPLDDTPWSRGKCGYKIIQYMACGLPVVASPVGVNSDIVEDGVTGFLASTPAEWRQAIARLLRDPELRRRMGRAGRRRVEERYSLQVWGPRVADLLHSAVRP
ncbi:glycosyltransferase family 4 protein [Paracoccus sp. (in: a-proteobacteria)]